jgi:hypothetical protein
MKIATFAELTPDEAKEYEDRRAKILELVDQLRLLEEAAQVREGLLHLSS